MKIKAGGQAPQKNRLGGEKVGKRLSNQSGGSSAKRQPEAQEIRVTEGLTETKA